jgi:hypothetical protein
LSLCRVSARSLLIVAVCLLLVSTARAPALFESDPEPLSAAEFVETFDAQVRGGTRRDGDRSVMTTSGSVTVDLTKSDRCSGGGCCFYMALCRHTNRSGAPQCCLSRVQSH